MNGAASAWVDFILDGWMLNKVDDRWVDSWVDRCWMERSGNGCLDWWILMLVKDKVTYSICVGWKILGKKNLYVGGFSVFCYIFPSTVFSGLEWKQVYPDSCCCDSAHSNWGIMAMSVEGMFVSQEKAKPQISPPYTHTKPVLVIEQPYPKSIQQRSLLFQS